MISVAPKKTGGKPTLTGEASNRWSDPSPFGGGDGFIEVVFSSDIQISNDELLNQILMSTNTATFKDISYIYLHTILYIIIYYHYYL